MTELEKELLNILDKAIKLLRKSDADSCEINDLLMQIESVSGLNEHRVEEEKDI